MTLLGKISFTYMVCALCETLGGGHVLRTRKSRCQTMCAMHMAISRTLRTPGVHRRLLLSNQAPKTKRTPSCGRNGPYADQHNVNKTDAHQMGTCESSHVSLEHVFLYRATAKSIYAQLLLFAFLVVRIHISQQISLLLPYRNACTRTICT